MEPRYGPGGPGPAAGYPPQNMAFPGYPGHPGGPVGAYPPGEIELMERARAAGAAEQHYNPQVHATQHYAANARHIAVERYRAKRKRRLEAPNTNGARYVKMKAVADGKKRSSSGKFVKKIKSNGDENLALEAPQTEQAEPMNQKDQMESHEERQHEDQDNEQQQDEEENVQDANPEGNDE